MKTGDACSTAKKKTGVDYYTLNLINALGEIDRGNSCFLYGKSSIFNKKKVFPVLPADNFRYLINRFKIFFAWMLSNLDVFHASSYDSSKPKNTKLAFTVHDVIRKSYLSGHASEIIKKVDERLKIFCLARIKLLLILLLPEKTFGDSMMLMRWI